MTDADFYDTTPPEGSVAFAVENFNEALDVFKEAVFTSLIEPVAVPIIRFIARLIS